MKYYGFDTLFRTLADDLSAYLKRNHITYERSALCPGYHFEILLDLSTKNRVNRWLDSQSIYQED